MDFLFRVLLVFDEFLDFCVTSSGDALRRAALSFQNAFGTNKRPESVFSGNGLDASYPGRHACLGCYLYEPEFSGRECVSAAAEFLAHAAHLDHPHDSAVFFAEEGEAPFLPPFRKAGLRLKPRYCPLLFYSPFLLWNARHPRKAIRSG